MAKKFKGSLLVLVLLILFCWPAAIVYFLIKREEMYACPRCGGELEYGMVTCPYCNLALHGGGPGPEQGYYPPPP